MTHDDPCLGGVRPRRLVARRSGPDVEHVYRSCFSNERWRRDYGYAPQAVDMEADLASVLYANYSQVTRLVFLRDYEAVGFVHFCEADARPAHYWLSGGIDPRFAGRGLGPPVACAAVDFAFRHLAARGLLAFVRPHNTPSLRILLSLGFAVRSPTAQPAGRHPRPSLHLSLEPSAFPTSFADRLLRRYGYLVDSELRGDG